MRDTNNFSLGPRVLHNALVNLISQEDKFASVDWAAVVTDKRKVNNSAWRYYFGENCNDDQKQRIIKRPKSIHDNRRALAYDHRKSLGNPDVTWMVGRRLSSTTLIIVKFTTQSTYWDVFSHGDDRAIALTQLAIHNDCYGDWTLS